MNRIDLGARSLEYAEGGDLAGAPVLVHHGTPGAAVLRPEWEELAAAHGLRLVIHSRPGYGSSTRLPGRNVADAAGDTAALADALGVARFLTLGYSGGGPHALACAALLPERVVAAVTLASVAPHDADQLDFLAGMGEGNIEEFGRARAGEEPLRELLEAEVGAMLGGSAAGLAESMAPFLSPVDAEEIRGPIAAWLQENVDRALGTGVDGWLDDDLAFVRPWGFEPAAVAAPVQLWQGRDDAMVPFAHGEWLAGRLPRVEARLGDADGHLSLLAGRAPEWIRWLRQHWDADGR